MIFACLAANTCLAADQEGTAAALLPPVQKPMAVPTTTPPTLECARFNSEETSRHGMDVWLSAVQVEFGGPSELNALSKQHVLEVAWRC